MRICLFCLLWAAAQADVRVFVKESQGLAVIHYQCTTGEVIQAFALDAVVDQGVIVGVSDYFRGLSLAEVQGYGIFPASFREHLAVSPNAEVNWNAAAYSPVAVPGDYPEDTLPGLGSHGVTLELAALWDPSVPEAIPGPAGTLCALHLSEAAQVSLSPNTSRGGVLSASTDVLLRPTFAGAFVEPSILIRGAALSGETLTIDFQGGELQSATSVEGPWVATGNSTGRFLDSVRTNTVRFFRVRRL